MAHVSQAKKKIVAEYSKFIEEYPIIGSINMAGLPAPQLQKMREQLRGKIELKVGKRRLIKIAIENSKKKDIKKLLDYVEGQPALLFTKENPFNLYNVLKKGKSTAPAKAGQVAPKDIVVPAGPTGFAPGPVIGELGAVGIKAGIDGGKVAIKEDSVVAKKGDVISSSLAGLLTRLKIEPMEVGLDLTAVYEEGEIFERDVLDINIDEYRENITSAHQWSFNLAMNSNFPTSETIEIMMQKASMEAKSLAISQHIINSDTADEIISLFYSHAINVAGHLSEDAMSDDLKNIVSNTSIVTAAPAAEDNSDKDEEQKEDNNKKDDAKDSEADAAAGLGALFG